jgi:CoA:oxalate CoA-transferase
LIPILEKTFKERHTADWLDVLQSNDVPCSPIHSIEQIVGDPVVAHRQMLVTVRQPGVGQVKIAGSPFRMSNTPGQVYSHAPLLGEHSIEVLRDVLKYSDDSIRVLREKNVIYSREDLSRNPQVP